MRTDKLLPCMIDPIPSCAIWAGIWTGIDAMQGAPLSIRTWGFYAGCFWCYRASICPMEAIHGRQSVLQWVVLYNCRASLFSWWQYKYITNMCLVSSLISEVTSPPLGHWAMLAFLGARWACHLSIRTIYILFEIRPSSVEQSMVPSEGLWLCSKGRQCKWSINAQSHGKEIDESGRRHS